jgi:tetratricopeptide (TPR) repeat protein
VSESRRSSGPWSWALAALLGLIVIGAPLAVGAVHRPLFLATLAVASLASVVAAGISARVRPDFASARVLVVPLCFLLIACVQVVPLPDGIRASLDATGTELLRLAGVTGKVPWSLDPPATYQQIAKAGAAACVMYAAWLLAGGRRFRHWVPTLVAAAGCAVMVVGLGHRAALADLIYGQFRGGAGVLMGPFINPNHQAEFLELAAFAALAVAAAARTRNQIRVWRVIAAILAAGAIATLSRGAVLGLSAGALVWLRLLPKPDKPEARSTRRFVSVLLGLGMFTGATLALGGEQIVGEFVGGNTTKLEVWKNALAVLRAHPLGIGLGAFSRVFPVYQTLPPTVRFEFVENQPLSFLIEAGIPGALLMGIALFFVVRGFFRAARRDEVEAALAAAIIAVLVHNVFDFGLEVLGILLPFCAVVGALYGRLSPNADAQRAPRTIAAVPMFWSAATIAGGLLLFVPSARDFETLLAQTRGAERLAVASAACLAHPTDYYFALVLANLQPRNQANLPSRIHHLNRAMLLCPTCSAPHSEAATALWQNGHRNQALLEWKSVLQLSPGDLWNVFAYLHKEKATANEITSLANQQTWFLLSQALLANGMAGAAGDVLRMVEPADGLESRLVRAQIALAENDLSSAATAVQRARESNARDLRVVLLSADLAVKSKQPDRAIEELQGALASGIRGVDLDRRLVALLIQTNRWQAAEQALEGLRAALVEAGAPLFEANLVAAGFFEQTGQYRRAITEYRSALAQRPDDVGLWLALGRAAEHIANVATAKEALAEVLRREPQNAEAKAGQARLNGETRSLEDMLRATEHIGAPE